MNKYLSILLVLFFVWLPLVPAQAPYQVNTLLAGSINGGYFPALCGNTSKPTWCGNDPSHPGTVGTTVDSWVRAACASLPAGQGVIDFLGMSGTWAATVRSCANPAKQIIYLQDLTITIHITETDGDISLPLDKYSMFLGWGAGQCNFGAGLWLSAGANVAAIVGPAHTDGSQEALTINGTCVTGNPGATVTQGLVLIQGMFANTTVSNNNIQVCNGYCILVNNSSSIQMINNWLNASDGSTFTFSAGAILIEATGGGGCRTGTLNISSGQIEHSYGGIPDIWITGDGTGALVCGVHISDVGVERNSTNGSMIAILVSDCWSCTIDHITPSGTNGGNDLIKFVQTAAGRTLNGKVTNTTAGGAYTNVINDTTPGGQVWTFAAHPNIDQYLVQAGSVGGTIYSAASNPIPTCSAQTLGIPYTVSDAPSASSGTAYGSGGGSVTWGVLCSFDGSTYSWLTH